MMKRDMMAAALAAIALTACATTDEMQLSKNEVLISTETSGLLYTGRTGEITMERAAKATLARGYSHFVITDAASSSGSRVAGVNTFGNATFNGNSAWGSTYATPIYQRTASAQVRVVMLNQGDPGWQNAIDAAAILAK